MGKEFEKRIGEEKEGKLKGRKGGSGRFRDFFFPELLQTFFFSFVFFFWNNFVGSNLDLIVIEGRGIVS